MVTSVRAWGGAAFVVLAGVAPAQGVAPDADRTVWPVTTIRSNGTWNGRAAFVVRSSVRWADGRYRIEDAGGAACALVIEDGGQLEIARARVELRGDFEMLEGGRATLVDSEFTLQCSFPREFNYEFTGGHFDTSRVVIGGRTEGAQICNFFLDAGLWTARDTVVNYSGGIRSA